MNLFSSLTVTRKISPHFIHFALAFRFSSGASAADEFSSFFSSYLRPSQRIVYALPRHILRRKSAKEIENRVRVFVLT